MFLCLCKFSKHVQSSSARGPGGAVYGAFPRNESKHFSHWSPLSTDQDVLSMNPVVSSSPGMPNKENISDNAFVSVGKHQNKVFCIIWSLLIGTHRDMNVQIFGSLASFVLTRDRIESFRSLKWPDRGWKWKSGLNINKTKCVLSPSLSLPVPPLSCCGFRTTELWCPLSLCGFKSLHGSCYVTIICATYRTLPYVWNPSVIGYQWDQFCLNKWWILQLAHIQPGCSLRQNDFLMSLSCCHS